MRSIIWACLDLLSSCPCGFCLRLGNLSLWRAACICSSSIGCDAMDYDELLAAAENLIKADYLFRHSVQAFEQPHILGWLNAHARFLRAVTGEADICRAAMALGVTIPSLHTAALAPQSKPLKRVRINEEQRPEGRVRIKAAPRRGLFE